MKSPHFLALLLVSLISSVMMAIDGWYARRVLQTLDTFDNPDSVLSMAYWQLWVPLLFVQVVVVILAHKNRAAKFQRNGIYLGVFLFVVASMYSLIGYHALKMHI